MKTCPNCHQTQQQRKIGFTAAGSQRYQCRACGRRYTPEPKAPGYSDDLRRQAVEWYVDGLNFRRIARHLHVHHQTIINWINGYAASVPETPPLPDEVEVIEQDELFTFIGSKKTSFT